MEIPKQVNEFLERLPIEYLHNQGISDILSVENTKVYSGSLGNKLIYVYAEIKHENKTYKISETSQYLLKNIPNEHYRITRLDILLINNFQIDSIKAIITHDL